MEDPKEKFEEGEYIFLSCRGSIYLDSKVETEKYGSIASLRSISWFVDWMGEVKIICGLGHVASASCH